MRIGILGAGRIGATAARLFAAAGHEVLLANSRGPESLADTVAELGPTVRAGTAREAADFGEVVLLAVPWTRRDALPGDDAVAGKVVIDAMNPYSAEGPVIDLGPENSSSEEVAARFPSARIVKAFNTISSAHLGTRGRPAGEDRMAIFVAGDDPEAKVLVMSLIDEIGFDGVDTGSLAAGGRRQQPGSDLYNAPMSAQEARERLGAA